MKYRVLKAGLSQREKPDGNPVSRAVGAVIEVSDLAAPGLIEAGFLEDLDAPRRAPRKDKEAEQ